MEFLEYCWRAIVLAFSHSISISQAIIFVLIIIFGFAGLRLPPDISGWQIAAGIFGAVILVRLLLAPYWIWQEEHVARLKAEQSLPATKDRSKIISGLKAFYSRGATIQRNLLRDNVSDDKIDAALTCH